MSITAFSEEKYVHHSIFRGKICPSQHVHHSISQACVDVNGKNRLAHL